jgi:DNA polymerase III epsilon subunit family exonuclease
MRIEELLRTSLDDALLSFLDVETTGLYPSAGHRICEIGISRVRGWKEVGFFSTLVNPGRHIPSDATMVNGITDSMVRDAPKFEEIANEVLDMLVETVVVCHNVPFDMGFLRKEMDIAGIDLPPLLTLDTLELARNWFDFPSNSLDFLAKAFEIPSPRHRGIEDARTTCQLLKSMIGFVSRRGVEIRTIGDLLLAQTGLNNEGEMRKRERIMEAMERGRRIRISYISWTGELSRREVYPKGLQGQYLFAFCTMRGEDRTFKISRILEIELLEEDST